MTQQQPQADRLPAPPSALSRRRWLLFSHQGDGCTFETLCSVFGIEGLALSRIAAILHDLDLKDGKFGAPECSTLSAMIEGLQLAYQHDAPCLNRA